MFTVGEINGVSHEQAIKLFEYHCSACMIYNITSDITACFIVDGTDDIHYFKVITYKMYHRKHKQICNKRRCYGRHNSIIILES